MSPATTTHKRLVRLRQPHAQGSAKTRGSWVILAAMVIGACCQDHTDPSGTYVGDGNGTYQARGAPLVGLTFPRDTVSVKMTSRNYQYSDVEVTVRGCVVRGIGGGESGWSISSGQGRRCTFDVPSVGPVEIALDGGVSRSPATMFSGPESLHISLHGSSEKVQQLSYTIDAAPRP